MGRKPKPRIRKATPAEHLALQRKALDAMQGLAEATGIKYADVSLWFDYLCIKEDARGTARDKLDSGDPEEVQRGHNHSPMDELEESAEIWQDDSGEAQNYALDRWERIEAMAEKYDPDQCARPVRPLSKDEADKAWKEAMGKAK